MMSLPENARKAFSRPCPGKRSKVLRTAGCWGRGTRPPRRGPRRRGQKAPLLKRLGFIRRGARRLLQKAPRRPGGRRRRLRGMRQRAGGTALPARGMGIAALRRAASRRLQGHLDLWAFMGDASRTKGERDRMILTPSFASASEKRPTRRGTHPEISPRKARKGRRSKKRPRLTNQIVK
jgi:hypothetical protein